MPFEQDQHAQIVSASDIRPGSAPGLLVAPEGSPPSRLDVVVSGDGVWQLTSDADVTQMESIQCGLTDGQWVWLDINGMGTPEMIAAVGRLFGLHRLSLEDALRLHQRPKTESYPSYQYTVLQVPSIEAEEVVFEQVSLFTGDRFLITLQSNAASCLTSLHDRVTKGAPRLTGSGVDYLFAAGMDVLVDQSLPVVEQMDEQVEDMENRIFAREGAGMLEEMHSLRWNATVLRRVMWNQSLVPDQLLKGPTIKMDEATQPYFRDVQDHAHRALGLAEQLKDSANGLFDLQNSISGAQLNEVMKVLTIISTVFIPLTFVVGVYGMNFNPEISPWNMPELNWRYGYLFAWGLMVLLFSGMLWLFQKKGWIGGRSGRMKK